MAKHKPESFWQEIKTKYELGQSTWNLSKEYLIAESTIRARKEREKWTQKLQQQVTVIKEKISEIAESLSESQFSAVQEQLDEILQLRKSLNTYKKGVVNLNIKNLRDTLAEPDPFKRIIMTSRMKATIPDLAAIGQSPELLNLKPNEENEKSEGIQFYLPDNGRDK
jgi:LysM repeat protein